MMKTRANLQILTILSEITCSAVYAFVQNCVFFLDLMYVRAITLMYCKTHSNLTCIRALAISPQCEGVAVVSSMWYPLFTSTDAHK